MRSVQHAVPHVWEPASGARGHARQVQHDIMDDDVESDGSSISEVMAPGHPLSWECAMADAPGQPPVVVESLQTHNPLDARVKALARAQEHGKELRQRR